MRSDCFSIMCESTVGEYLDFIAATYRDRGNIEEQRDVLSTKSAITIRNRMVEDIKSGALLPPIVLGITATKIWFEKLNSVDATVQTATNSLHELTASILTDEDGTIALIDGMQRTTALTIAADANEKVRKMVMRLELWITTSSNTLLYRMLVLNTGQIPWDTRKQLEVIFRSVTKDARKAIPGLLIFTKEDDKDRKAPMEYRANHLIEMFIAFSSRTEKLDPKEKISQEFSRLDLVESTNNNDVVNFFIRILAIFCKMDKIFSRDESEGPTDARTFANGRALMSSQPLRIGFMAALGIKVFGKPGRDRTAEDQKNIIKNIEEQLGIFLQKWEYATNQELKDFLSIDTLNGMRPKSSSRIGEHDRKFFKDAFGEMIKSLDDMPSMEPCWREAE